jgi:parallel beta-helix repeat protein
MKTERNSLLGELVFPVILLCALILLILVVYGVEITLVTDELVNVVTPAQARAWQATNGNQALSIGGFNASRGGSGSFPAGDFFTDARTAITETYPAVSFPAFGTLTQQEIEDVDILILSSNTGEDSAILPLSSQEQSALTAFVESGGCTVILADNDSYDSNAQQANKSLTEPFDVSTSGTFSGPLIAKVSNTTNNPITSGPQGSITSFIQSSPGGITNLGTYATSAAANELGFALAFIERGLLGTGSGPVAVYSDHDSFKSASAGGYFQSNRELFLNTIAFCLNKSKVYLPSVHNTNTCTLNKTTTGLMKENENWCEDTLITGTVEIPSGVILRIQPGVTIRFQQHRTNILHSQEPSLFAPRSFQSQSVSIVVFGRLTANGTADKQIVFTSGHEVPGTRDWDSIAIEEGGQVDLDHVVLEHGYFGLQVNTPTSQASVNQSTFRYVTTTGIATGDHPINGPIIVSDSQFLECGREAIDTYQDQNIIIRRNVFSDNFVAIMSVGSSVVIESNLFVKNSRGIGIVENGDPKIIGNEFTENTGSAIFATEVSPLIAYNNLESNLFNIYLEQSVLGVSAENNWWGSSQVGAIEALIWDGNDDPGLGLVDYVPFADNAFDLDVPQIK